LISNNNFSNIVYGAVITAQPLREFTGLLDECRTGQAAANPETKPTDFDVM